MSSPVVSPCTRKAACSNLAVKPTGTAYPLRQLWMKILTPQTDVSRHWKCAMLKYNNIQPTYEIQQRQPEQINAQAEDAYTFLL